ncbi:response regulator transcription factor [Microscilla marina]|uniref:Transcriptional regulator, LuxR family protein n=1 Tax=Microscilla marina ATCC 23134 TaxID=313606 RepID=A1ZG57_MICM2|nr:helix-turn-helix transcriptional regulator [Microscilla marina]EAY30474.1 transcriptional regulator, LuxR family protein [Microscilla marina ATCC 23134]
MKRIVSEKEILEALERQAFLIEQKLNLDAMSIVDLNESVPKGVMVTLNSSEDFVPVYLSDQSLKMLDAPRELYFKNPSEYIQKLVYPGDFEKNASIVSSHFSGENRFAPVSFIQRLKLYGGDVYEGMFTVTKQNRHKKELSNILIRVKNLGQVTNKMTRLLEETLYVRHHYHKFASLTAREKEIITLLALGYQNSEIGEQLFISKATVEQHRKNLKRKLEIKRFVDLIRFAQAFDLI